MNNQYYWAIVLPFTLAPLSVSFAGGNHQTIEELIITASPHGKSSGDIAGSLNVLSGETLQRELSATLGDTLKQQVGISSSSFGPGVGLPVIRGLSGNRVEVLQNSSPVVDASQTSPDHAIALEPMLADRIEILRGPASLRYGPGAIGGVVNIIDNRIHTSADYDAEGSIDGAIEGRFDSNNDGTAYVGRMDGAKGPLNLHLSGILRENNNMDIPGYAATVDNSDETTNGYVANTDAEANAWSLGISHISDNLVVGLAMSRIDNNYGVPPGGHGHHEHEEDHLEEDHDEEHGEEDEEEHGDVFTRIDMRQTDYSGKILLPNLSGMFDKLDIDLSHSEYQHRELEIEDTDIAVGTSYTTKGDNLRAELTHGSDANWLGALGIQFSRNEFVAEGEEAFLPPNDVLTAGIFLTEETTVGNGVLTMGLRYDNQQADPAEGSTVSHDLINASASYLLNLGAYQQLSLILSHSQRAPSAEELFSDGEHAATGNYLIGDTGLNRESANSVELTWSYQGPFSLNASLYHREFSDFIYAFADGNRLSHDLLDEGLSGDAVCSTRLADFDDSEEEFGESLPCYRYQQEDARFTGAEAELTLLPTPDASLRLWGDLVKARLENNGDVPRLPPARVGFNADYSWENALAGISLTHGFEQDRPGINESATKSYTRVDIHLSLTNGPWTVFAKGNNLSDEEIRNATSFLRELAPEPGRSWVIGLRYNL